MLEEELVQAELEAQKKQVEKKKKKASDAHVRKANKVKGYVYSLYTLMEILVIFFLCSKTERRAKPHASK